MAMGRYDESGPITVNVNLILPDRAIRLLEYIAAGVSALQLQGKKTMATLDEVLDDVQQESTQIDGLTTLTAGLKQQLADALAGVTLPPAVQAKVDAVFAGVEANKQKVVDAINANTPADTGGGSTGGDTGGDTGGTPTP